MMMAKDGEQTPPVKPVEQQAEDLLVESRKKQAPPAPPAPPGPPVFQLTEREHENLKEIMEELEQLNDTNATLDFQKAQVLQTISNKRLERQRLLEKAQRRLGLPNGINVNVDPEKGTITPIMGMQRMV